MAEAVRVKHEEEQSGGGPSFKVPGPVNRLMEYPRRFRQFLHDVRVELKQVTWPTTNDVRATTAVVIVTVFFFGLFLALVDTGVSRIVDQVLRMFRP